MEIKIYPNPVTDRLFVENIDNDDFEFSIIDLQGQMVKSGRYTDSGIFISELPVGVYFVRISNDLITQVNRIIRD